MQQRSAAQELAVEYRSPGALQINPRNARTHSKRQVRQIAASIEAFGFLNPILVDGAGTVLAGHGRLAAAKLLGLAQVPTLCAATLLQELHHEISGLTGVKPERDKETRMSMVTGQFAAGHPRRQLPPAREAPLGAAQGGSAGGQRTRAMTRVAPLQPRYVTEASCMPESNRPDDGQPSPPPLSNAERQARWRARRQAQQHALVPVQPTKATSTHKRSRPRRWRDAVAELLTLQAEYAAWLEALPVSLQDSATAETLAAIVELDLDALASTELPRGYGRD